jgi:ketosteroid isomerase-like protein
MTLSSKMKLKSDMARSRAAGAKPSDENQKMTAENTEAMRTILLRAADGTADGVQQAATRLADDVRIWQQGIGWLGKADKIKMWTETNTSGVQFEKRLISIVAEDDKVATEMLIAMPGTGSDYMVTMFAKFSGGRMIEGREFLTPVAAAEIFAS